MILRTFNRIYGEFHHISLEPILGGENSLSNATQSFPCDYPAVLRNHHFVYAPDIQHIDNTKNDGPTSPGSKYRNLGYPFVENSRRVTSLRS